MPEKKTKKWIMIALCFLMVFTALGFCSSNKSLYLSAITEALGIERGAFSVNDSCRFITTAVINVFFGTLVNKFGTKKLICAGFLCLIGSCLIYAYAANIFVFYIGGCLLGLGLAWTTTTMVGWIVGKWCKENKGTVMGAVLAANGFGGALASQIVSPIIYRENNIFGYRQAYLLVAGILLCVALLFLFFYREPPEEDSPAQKKKPRGQSWDGIEYGEAKKTPYFYLALICIFFTGMILQGINGIAAAFMKDVGMDASYVASVLSIQLLVLAASKFLTGIMYDKFGLRITMLICDVSAVAVMIILYVITNSPTGRVLAVLYAVFASLALPLETIVLPIFAGDLFGEKAYNKTLGLFVSVNTAGYALGTPLMNKCFDISGTYKPMFAVCALLMIFITVTTQAVIIVAHKKRNNITEVQYV